MSIYQATIFWQRQSEEVFIDAKYSRAHKWSFDGGATIDASSSPSVVPLPFSKPDNVDPEEAFVASLSSCHMLFFLHFAAKSGYIVESYEDSATGIMSNNAHGKMAMTEVILKPRIKWQQPESIDKQTVDNLHHQAHEACFIANSVYTEIKVE
ncbi:MULTISPECIES: OsmC family protein [Pseudoalteromonas]|uniref:Putative redox protein, regulator of disulfide bond formation n=1 Tax=Pseudoalteromonas luteoviolacea (strain 2ta16) TaxID=1353533 RepID=V4HU26_PSEL2|nr:MULTISPECIES: OsmC family protein [Pseudoalteromonas]ESP94295.1 putative redox protein, regulator of disulfide bond formation [Pseudoalteromonas luteoviolacea 2ta16]KZN36163.1 hypothetical protein N483_23140 [Pseudoalteromonas luteoviolacea NCIMB 1944]MCG7549572.1 OsmC family protein [Pseudoalteromonas sp. Of7M-16]